MQYTIKVDGRLTTVEAEDAYSALNAGVIALFGEKAQVKPTPGGIRSQGSPHELKGAGYIMIPDHATGDAVPVEVSAA